MNRCKKLIRNIAATALTLVMVTGIASAAFGIGTVKEGPLRIRASASTSSQVLGNAPKGAKVTVLEDAKYGWYKISYKGKTGYMSADYLKVTPNKTETASAPVPVPEETVPLVDEPAEVVAVQAETSPAEPEPAVEAPGEAPEYEYAMVTASALNVRSGPSTECAKVGSVHCRSIVHVLSVAGEWAKIEYNSVTGYVSCEYLTFGDKDELLASVTAGQQIIDIAKQYLGVPYKYGGTSPSGFDCSGFIYYVAKQAGYSVPRIGTDMWNKYPHVSREDLQPGDIVFFTKTGGNHYITHVGLYVGNNTFIHSSSPRSGGVIYTSLSETYYATRYVGAARAFT